jgi:hypothetical protein
MTSHHGIQRESSIAIHSDSLCSGSIENNGDDDDDLLSPSPSESELQWGRPHKIADKHTNKQGDDDRQ